jgi:hypothetical protein
MPRRRRILRCQRCYKRPGVCRCRDTTGKQSRPRGLWAGRSVSRPVHQGPAWSMPPRRPSDVHCSPPPAWWTQAARAPRATRGGLGRRTRGVLPPPPAAARVVGTITGGDRDGHPGGRRTLRWVWRPVLTPGVTFTLGWVCRPPPAHRYSMIKQRGGSDWVRPRATCGRSGSGRGRGRRG